MTANKSPHHGRFCPDQPVLMLRLEGTAARLYAQQARLVSQIVSSVRFCQDQKTNSDMIWYDKVS